MLLLLVMGKKLWQVCGSLSKGFRVSMTEVIYEEWEAHEPGYFSVALFDHRNELLHLLCRFLLTKFL